MGNKRTIEDMKELLTNRITTGEEVLRSATRTLRINMETGGRPRSLIQEGAKRVADGVMEIRIYEELLEFLNGKDD